MGSLRFMKPRLLVLEFKIYETKIVGSGEYMHYEFPESFSARWVRVTANKNCKATAWFIYN